MTQLLDDLKAVRDLLAVPERWTQHVEARNATSEHRWGTSTDATCWCLVGAIRRAVGDEADHRFSQVRSSLRDAIDESRPLLIHWNDDPRRTHADILALLDKAIAAEASR